MLPPWAAGGYCSVLLKCYRMKTLFFSVSQDDFAELFENPKVVDALTEAFIKAHQRIHVGYPHVQEKEPEPISLQEAATMLGLSPSTTRDKAARREIPAIKTGKMWRFFRADLITWLESNRRRTQQETRSEERRVGKECW